MCLLPQQVPLCLFKREKEIARKLEFDGQWIAEQPTRDDIKGQWDSLAISTRYEAAMGLGSRHYQMSFLVHSGMGTR